MIQTSLRWKQNYFDRKYIDSMKIKTKQYQIDNINSMKSNKILKTKIAKNLKKNNNKNNWNCFCSQIDENIVKTKLIRQNELIIIK